MTTNPLSDSRWTSHDRALWRTCEIADQLLHHETPNVGGDVFASFPVPAPDDRFWAAGPFQLLDYRAAGDGTYLRNDGFFFATGPLGIAATAVGMVARGAGNRSRRKAAELDAQPRWTPIADGEVYLAPGSFTMYPRNEVWTWWYSSITTAEMVSPRHLRFTGLANGDRAVNWILRSDWAELAFVSWSVRHHPQHPQLRNSQWLPAGWLTRAQQLSS